MIKTKVLGLRLSEQEILEIRNIPNSSETMKKLIRQWLKERQTRIDD